MEFEKFRDPIIDPFKIAFQRSIRIDKILNYPHAGNDVLHCLGCIEGNKTEFILKIARHFEADFKNETCILTNLEDRGIRIPEVIEYGLSEENEYLVLEKLPGKRIFFVLDDYKKNTSGFCRKIGTSLARIHLLEMNVEQVKERRFHKIPDSDEDTFLTRITSWLDDHKPQKTDSCFVNGDHHYANILWENREISGVLDWEFSGSGNKEFDIAWAVFVRSSALYHDFLSTGEEENEILEGYRSLGSFNYHSFQYYKAQILSHLYTAKKLSQNYKSWIEKEFVDIIGIGRT